MLTLVLFEHSAFDRRQVSVELSGVFSEGLDICGREAMTPEGFFQFVAGLIVGYLSVILVALVRFGLGRRR